MAALVGIAYRLLVGLPLCAILIAAGLLACVTIVGLPVGLALIAARTKVLTIDTRTRVYY